MAFEETRKKEIYKQAKINFYQDHGEAVGSVETMPWQHQAYQSIGFILPPTYPLRVSLSFSNASINFTFSSPIYSYKLRIVRKAPPQVP